MGELKKGLKSSADFDNAFDQGQGIHQHPLERNEIVQDNKPTEPGQPNEVKGNTEEDNVKVFERIYVTNMIKTCVDKLGVEYEQNGHNSCRKVSSVGAEINVGVIEATEQALDNERKILLEVHMLSFCPCLNVGV